MPVFIVLYRLPAPVAQGNRHQIRAGRYDHSVVSIARTSVATHDQRKTHGPKPEWTISRRHTAAGPTIDPGLACLTLLLRFHGIAVNGDQILHKFGTNTIGILEMLRCAKQYGLKAKSRVTTWSRLATHPAAGHRATPGRQLRLRGKGRRREDPASTREQSATGADEEGAVRGGLEWSSDHDDPAAISLLHLSGRFDIGWSCRPCRSTNTCLGEVLIASFFLQMFGLVSPLIFQVVIDKVLVHQNLSTLERA